MKAKFLIAILFFFFTIHGYGQNYQIKGVLYNEDTKEAIPYAAIGVNNFSTGTITNIQGEFSLTINKNADSLIVSHLNYGKQLLAFDKTKTGIQKFYIKAKEILLEELVVTSVPVSTILLNAVEKSEESLTIPILLNTYYREFVRTDGKYTKFSDGLLNYYLSGNKKLKVDLSVSDSRSVELYDESEEEIDWDMTSVLDVRDIIEETKVSNVAGFLKEDNIENYNYKLSIRKDKNGDEFNIIKISPKDGIEKALSEGEVVIEIKSGLILEIECRIPYSHKQYLKEINALIIKAKVLSMKERVIFQHTNNSYNLFYLMMDGEIRVWNNKKIDNQLGFISDLIVTNTQKENIQFNKSERYNKKSLYKRDIPTKEEFWLKYNSIQLTGEEQKIIQQLNNSKDSSNK